jgi:hypothetical protein
MGYLQLGVSTRRILLVRETSTSPTLASSHMKRMTSSDARCFSRAFLHLLSHISLLLFSESVRGLLAGSLRLLRAGPDLLDGHQESESKRYTVSSLLFYLWRADRFGLAKADI